MNNRDELAKLLFVADNDAAPDPYHEWEMAIRHNPRYAEYAFTMADALIRAGYSRPRTVSTVEELDALPGSAVVKDALEQVFEKQEAGIWHDGPHDWLAFDGKFWDVDAIHLPASVLYEPEGK